MERRYRVINIVLTSLIIISFGLLAFFVYKESYMRVGEAFADLWNSLKFFVKEVFMLDFEAKPTVLDYSKVLEWQKILPEDWSNFAFKFKTFFSLFATGENFNLYMDGVGTGLANFSKSLVIIIPVGLILWLIIKAIYSKGNVKHNKDTLPLKLYKGITRITVIPVRNFLRQYIRFYRSNQNLMTFTIIIWLLNFNLITVLVEFLAYYFYFVVTYEVATIYTQIGKLFIDLQAIFLHVPLWIILIFVIRWLHNRRKAMAKSHLRHMEARNCGFINELSIVNMACGSMGKKKTTLITDMSLSQEVIIK